MAQKKSNVIEINGKRYDATSGQLLGEAASRPKQPATGVSMDGVVRGNPVVAPVAATPVKAPAATVATPTKPQRQFSDFVRSGGMDVQPHKPGNSQTLMRHAVKKPAPSPSLKRHTKVQQRTDVLVKQPTVATVKPKLSSYQLDPARVERAKRTARHQEVNRYAAPRHNQLPAKTTTVQPKPKMAAHVAPVYAQSAASAAIQPAAVPVKPASRPMDVFEQALARANSHVAKPLPRRKVRRRKAIFGTRALSISAASLAVLLLVGFFAWQQKATLTMRYAANKAGVAASLPAYKPAGFTAGKFTYSPGLVAVNFHNTQSNQSFALVEQTSNWDSQALLDSFVSTKSKTYQTIDAAGRTIYTYGNNNATWVDNGVWYQVNSQGSLTTNQLVQLALSM